MNNKEQYYSFLDAGIIQLQTPEQRVEFLANELLRVLFTPTEESTLFIPDWDNIEKLGIESTEPVNWLSLTATVELELGVFIVTIDEASPDCCHTLCAYIAKYLTAWGWNNVIVETEW